MAEEPTVALGIAGLGPAVRIGSGGFADVYRAQQTNLRREVAVKLLRAPANDQQSRMRFERECHAVGAVSGHPNIVGVHEGGFTADGRAYLVMEYFPGGSLLDRIERSGPMSAVEVIDVGLKIGKALGVAHEAGVLHRDVKPANILVSAYGEPALADFGIARVEGGQQTATGMVTASFAHAPPEVLEGGSPSAASDIYSLGSTLFELFCGWAPHVRSGDESVLALMNRVVNQPVPDPGSLGMPEPLASSIRRATSQQPGNRHPSAAEFVAQLSASGPSSVAGAGSPAAPPTRLARPDGQVGEHNPTIAMPEVPAHGTPPSVPASPLAGAAQTTPGGADAPTMAYRPGDPQGLGTGAANVTPGPVVERQAAPGPQAAPGGVQTGTGAGAYDALDVTDDRDRGSRGSGRRRGRALFLLGFVALAAAAVAGVLFAVPTLTGSDLPPLVLSFEEGSSGPVDAGSSYDLAVAGAEEATAFRIIVDGEPIGTASAELEPFVPIAGRHSVAVEATRGDDVSRTDVVEIYAVGALPDAGFRANLVSITARPDNWPAAISRFDELVAEGHTDLQLLPSDRFPTLPGGFWNVFVPGFRDNRGAGLDYCARFELSIPDECFVTFFDPNA